MCCLCGITVLRVGDSARFQDPVLCSLCTEANPIVAESVDTLRFLLQTVRRHKDVLTAL